MNANEKKNMNNIKNITPPTDDVYGFWGTVQTNSYCEETDCNHIDEAAANRIWTAACLQVAKTFDEKDPDVIRNFLRSRWGRHLADELFTPGCHEKNLIARLAENLNERRYGVLVWKSGFREVKEATENGTWVD